MKTVFESRACTIIYNLSMTRGKKSGVWLVPANVCFVVPLALELAGQTVEFIDIDQESLCMDRELLLSRISSNSLPSVDSVIYVRTYGVKNHAEPLFKELKKNRPSLLLIDDRCASRPEPDLDDIDWQGADAVLFSTGYAKHVDLGFGGFGHIRCHVEYQRHSRKYLQEHMDTLSSLIKRHIRQECARALDISHLIRQYSQWLETKAPGLAWEDYRALVLEERERSLETKALYNSIYRDLIPAPLQFAEGFQTWRFHVRLRNKREVLKRIFSSGYFASSHYYPVSLLFAEKTCPQAEQLCAEVLNLFNDRYVTKEQVKGVAKIVKDYGQTSV